MGSPMTRSLTSGEKCRLLSGLIDLAPDWSLTMEHLIAKGFTSLRPWYESRLLACASNEIESFKTYEIEVIKETISDPREHFPSVFFGDTIGYRSPYLEGLRRWRNEGLGGDFEAARQMGIESWQYEIHPFLIRLAKAGTAEMHRAANEQNILRAQERAQELARFHVDSGRTYPAVGVLQADEFPELVNISHRGVAAHASLAKLKHGKLQESYCEQVSAEYGKFGYSLSSKHSTAIYPAFSKTLAGGWSLVIGNEMFGEKELVDSFDTVVLSLSLRNDKGRGALSKKNEINYLFLKIYLLARGINIWYKKFRNFDEMAIIIKANAALYSLVGNQVESVLLEGLRRQGKMGID